MNRTAHKTVLISGLLAICCGPAAQVHASDENALFDGPGRMSMTELIGGLRANAAAVPAPEAPAVQPASPGAGNNEFLHFWEDLKEDVFEDICGEAQIELSKDATIDNVGGIDGKFKRYLKQYPDNRIALIDEVGVRLDGGHTLSDVLSISGNSFNIGFHGSLEGKSVVVRKTDETRFCNSLLTVADLRKVKTILPVNARRIGEMKSNEIWKFPAVLRASISGGTGIAVQPWATVSFSLGSSREMKPSVTLYKMDENRLRLRIRLDRIHVQRAGVSAGTSFDAGLLGLPEAENFLAKELNKTVVREFNKYLALRLGLSHSRSKGKKLLLEFIIDTRDQEQVARLVDFLKGDLGIIKRLIEMGVRFNDSSGMEDNAEGTAALQNISQVASQGLGLNSTFSGSNHFSGSSNGFSLTLPIVVQRESSTSQRYDRYQAAGSPEVLHVHNAAKNESTSSLNLPVAGKIFKHNTNQNFYVVNYEGADGAWSDASVVYQRYEGYVKHEERNARGMIVKMNEILKYAGVKGEGTNAAYAVDAGALFPWLAAEEQAPTGSDSEGNPEVRARRYKSAMLSFSLVFTRQAVRDITSAPAMLVLKSVFNVMEGLEREIIGKVLHLFSAEPGGKVRYDWKEAKKLLAEYERDESGALDPFTAVDNFCGNVAAIIADIAGVNGADGQRAKAERLSEVLAGKGKSGLGYEGMMQVLIQLVSVKDLYASLNVQTDKRIEGESDIAATYQLYNPGLQNVYAGHLGAATALRDRFSDPSQLSD